MSEQVNKMVEEAREIYRATEEALQKDWDQKENLQFPNLLSFVVARLKANPEKASEVDPFMRTFVRKHPDYYVSRGAKGGIMLRSVYEARLNKKAQVEAAKKVLSDQVDATVATTPTVVVGDEVNG